MGACSASNSSPPDTESDLVDTDTVDTDRVDTATATASTSADSAERQRFELSDMTVLLNPYHRAPLSAIVSVYHDGLNSADVTEIAVTIAGKDGASDLTASLNPKSDAYHANYDMSDMVPPTHVGVPILGLYADYDNDVTFRILTAEAVFIGSATITTPFFNTTAGEVVKISVLNPEEIEPGWTYLNNLLYDHEGQLRWRGPSIHRIRSDGNIISRRDDYNWLGKTLVRRTLPDNLVHHHDTVELPNGNTLIGITNHGSEIINYAGAQVETVQDAALEYDNRTGEVVNYWDLRAFLDVSRAAYLGVEGDWFHLNTLCYDAHDDSVIMSGRHQGIVKITRGGIQGAAPNAGKELKWILAPHMDWDQSGWNGEGALNPRAFLLTAVNEEGVPFNDDVQNNLAAPTPDANDFFWPQGQHGLVITHRDKNIVRLLTFNNEASILYDGDGSVNNGSWFDSSGDRSNDRLNALGETPFSQMIEYEIDEAQMTVKKIWSYGEDDLELYGAYQSGLDVLPVTGNRMLFSTGVGMLDAETNPPNPTIVELNAKNEVVFHLEKEETTQLAYRGGRIDLYYPSGE